MKQQLKVYIWDIVGTEFDTQTWGVDFGGGSVIVAVGFNAREAKENAYITLGAQYPGRVLPALGSATHIITASSKDQAVYIQHPL